MNVKNIKEYVVNKIIENSKEIESLKKEIKNKDKKIRKMKNLLDANNICFECICSRCNKKILPDDIHSHDMNELYPTICYICFFQIL